MSGESTEPRLHGGSGHDLDFYAHLRAHYDALFPLDRARPEFLLSLVRGRRSFLDLGCATGTLCSALVDDFEAVEGWDLDEGFLSIARERCRTFRNLVFEPRDLRTLGKGRFRADLVSCLGNTLVHLDGREEILGVLRGMRRAIHSEGAAVVQTVNYDAVSHEAREFPVIEREGLRFLRRYDPRPDGRLDFTTVLESPEGTSRATTVLVPLKATELKELAREAGFGSVVLRGGYSRKVWNASSPATVAVLRR